MKKRRRKNRGVALILVLGSIAIMTVMLTEFQDEATGELSAALADRDALKAEYLARSGINLSRLLIAAEPIMRQPLSFLIRTQIPVWEYSDKILGAFNDKEASADFMALTNTDLSRGKNLGIEGGRFDVDIVDEDSKVNVNLAARGNPFTQTRLSTQLLGTMAGDQFTPLFERRDRDDNFSDRATVCGALIDWADADEDLNACDPYNASPSSKATEDISYQLLKTPFFRKNAPYDSLEELHLVRGVGDDFWATFVNPEPEKPKKRVMTVWGQGAVNVNTANAQTLLALVLAGSKKSKLWTDPVEMQKFFMGLTMFKAFTSGIPLFSSPQDFMSKMKGSLPTMIGIAPVQFDAETEFVKAITTESKVFSIYSDGFVTGYQRKTRVRIHAVVDFRGAPAPVAAALPGAPPGPLGSPAAAPAGGGATVTGTTSVDAIQAAMAPNPGGTIIYYRME